MANRFAVYSPTSDTLLPSSQVQLTVTAIKTSAYSATFGDLVRCNPSSGGFTVTLPTAVGNSGLAITIKNVTESTNPITVATTSGQTIDGASTDIINTPRTSRTYVSDGANWMLL